MADGGGSTAEQWALAPAERELVTARLQKRVRGEVEELGSAYPAPADG